MARISTLRELAAQVGDDELPGHSQRLGEGALANVAETMRLLSAADRRIQAAEANLEFCRVPFDPTPFRKVSECLNEAWEALQPAILGHIEACDRQKGGAR